MKLGSFTIDIKEVPLHFTPDDLLQCIGLYEENGGVTVPAHRREFSRKKNPSRTAFIRRIVEIPAASCGYQTKPGTRVYRTTWSSRHEPEALSRTAAIILDGFTLPLCRYGQDVCSVCFSAKHRTNGHERSSVRSLKSASSTLASPSLASLSLSSSSLSSSSLVSQPVTRTIRNGSAYEEIGAAVRMETRLRPLHFRSHTKVGGAVATRYCNGRNNAIEIVKMLHVSGKHRGEMASKGMYPLEPLTAAELGNGLSPIEKGSSMFVDLSSRTSLTSTILQNPRFARKNSKHLQPNLSNEAYRQASEDMDRRYGYSDIGVAYKEEEEEDGVP